MDKDKTESPLLVHASRTMQQQQQLATTSHFQLQHPGHKSNIIFSKNPIYEIGSGTRCVQIDKTLNTLLKKVIHITYGLNTQVPCLHSFILLDIHCLCPSSYIVFLD